MKALRAQRRESLVHEIVALKSYRDQLRATLASIDAEIAAKNTRLAAHDAESRTGSEEYQRLKTPRAAKKPARSVAEGECRGVALVLASSSPRSPCMLQDPRFFGRGRLEASLDTFGTL